MTAITFFLSTIILLNIMPGPAMLYVAHQTMNRGLRAGILSTLGIELGTLLHIAASILGLTIVISKSDITLMVIQCLSAVFLIYLGATQLMASRRMDVLSEELIFDVSGYSIFFKGILINVLNPKIIIFFIAFLPQFIDPEANHVSWHVLMLGGLFGLIGGLVNLIITIFVNKCVKQFANYDHRYTKMMRWSTWLVSVAFILFGISIILLRFLK